MIRFQIKHAHFRVSARHRLKTRPHYVLEFPELEEVRFSGGGIYNKTLMEKIREQLPEVTISTFDPAFSDAKEALSFAILAHETICGRPGNVLGATGASKRVVLGEIAV